MEHISNEQKAMEIAEYLNQPNGSNSLLECHQAAIQAMQWKDEQHAKEKEEWIKKAYKWCKERVFFPAAFDYDFDGFKKAMEEKL